MANQLKDKSVEILEEATLGMSNGFLIQCLYNWMDSNELEDFADFVETES